jgi:hypothetical protein
MHRSDKLPALISREPNMQKLVVAALLAAVAAAAHAQQPPAGAVVKATSPGKGTIAAAVEVRAKVVGIDKATRTVDLRRPDGSVVSIVAGEEVRNFNQLKLGDDVVVQYVRALTLTLMKSGSKETSIDVKTDAVRAKAGEQPGAAVGRQVHVVANVVAVNKKEKTVTLKGPRGNQVDLVLEDPKQLELVKKGDQVDAVYTEAVAISLEAAPAKPATAKK